MVCDLSLFLFQLSIFFDFLLAMFESVSEEEYVTGARSGRYGTQDVVKGEKAVIMHNARALLRKKLQGTKVKASWYISWLILNRQNPNCIFNLKLNVKFTYFVLKRRKS